MSRASEVFHGDHCMLTAMAELDMWGKRFFSRLCSWHQGFIYKERLYFFFTVSSQWHYFFGTTQSAGWKCGHHGVESLAAAAYGR